MRKVFVPVVAMMALFVFAAGPVAATEITVSPNVINIASASTVVTVHTDLPFSLVDGASVTLNGIEISWWKSDDRGNFVAKFDSDEFKYLGGLIEGEYNTLTLTGYTTGGEAFIGTQDILVLDNVPQGKK